MRAIVTILYATALMPAFGASPLGTGPTSQHELPSTIDLSLSVSPGLETLQSRTQPKFVGRPVNPKCYFIRQLKTDLKAPEAKARLIPLANANEALVTNGHSICITGSLVREAAAP